MFSYTRFATENSVLVSGSLLSLARSFSLSEKARHRIGANFRERKGRGELKRKKKRKPERGK
jgi:hypothetical protein